MGELAPSVLLGFRVAEGLKDKKQAQDPALCVAESRFRSRRDAPGVAECLNAFLFILCLSENRDEGT
jgi:hypothetical protein